jgi:hypothetical protein
MPEPTQLEFDFPRKLEIHINENLLVEEQPKAQAQPEEPWTPSLPYILAYMKTAHPANLTSALRALQNLTEGLCVRYLNSPSRELLLQGYVDIALWMFYFEHLAMVEGGLDVAEIKKEMGRRFEDKPGR